MPLTQRQQLLRLGRTVDPRTVGVESMLYGVEDDQNLPVLRRLLQERVHLVVQGAQVIPGEYGPRPVSARDEVARLIPTVRLVSIAHRICRTLASLARWINRELQDNPKTGGEERVRQAPRSFMRSVAFETIFPRGRFPIQDAWDIMRERFDTEDCTDDDMWEMTHQIMRWIQTLRQNWLEAKTRLQRILEATYPYNIMMYSDDSDGDEIIESGVYLIEIHLHNNQWIYLPAVVQQRSEDLYIMYTVRSPVPVQYTSGQMRRIVKRRCLPYFKEPSRIYLTGISEECEFGLVEFIQTLPSGIENPSSIISNHFPFNNVDEFYAKFTPAAMKHLFADDRKLLAFYEWADTKSPVYRATNGDFVREFNEWYALRIDLNAQFGRIALAEIEEAN
jgi:hypothetical protein